ncbi:MAG: hypothetical protein WBC75_05025, partial [Dehalococcoidales bacterium]
LALRESPGSFNSAVGHAALHLSPGSYNSAMGRSALYESAGSSNSAMGYNALRQSPGSYNFAGGYQAGYRSGGVSNVFLGANAGFSASPTVYTNAIAIGAGAVPLGNNTAVIGNAQTTSTVIRGTTTGEDGTATNHYLTSQQIDDRTAQTKTWYFHGSTDSDIAGCYEMNEIYSGSNETTIASAGTTNNEYIACFYTPTNEPALTSVRAGTWQVEVYANKGAPGAATFKAELYVASAAGVDRFEIDDTPQTAALTTTKTKYILTIVAPTNVVTTVDERWAIKLKATVSSGTPTINIYTEGTSKSHFKGNAGSGAEIDPLSWHLNGDNALTADANAGGFSVTNMATESASSSNSAAATTKYVMDTAAAEGWAAAGGAGSSAHTYMIGTGDWGGDEVGEGSLGTGTNNVVWTGYSTANATNNSLSGDGFYCSQTVLNSKYYYGQFTFERDTSLAVESLAIGVRSSSTGPLTNKVNILIDDTKGNTFATNNLVSTTAGAWNWYNFAAADIGVATWTNTLPNWTEDGGARTNYGLNVRADAFSSHSNSIQCKVEVRINTP